jgi:hypothetical protein
VAPAPRAGNATAASAASASAAVRRTRRREEAGSRGPEADRGDNGVLWMICERSGFVECVARIGVALAFLTREYTEPCRR